MEIHISTSFWDPLKQGNFSVKVIDQLKTVEYQGTYNEGEWAFKMFGKEKLFLESQRIKLSGKETFLGHQRYKILWEGNEIGILNKSYRKKEIIFDGKSHSFPKLFKPSINDLNLKFPLSTWIYRRNVKSYCTAVETRKIMLAIAMTIFIWFTWNALPAD
jgi:hypothetical protein